MAFNGCDVFFHLAASNMLYLFIGMWNYLFTDFSGSQKSVSTELLTWLIHLAFLSLKWNALFSTVMSLCGHQCTQQKHPRPWLTNAVFPVAAWLIAQHQVDHNVLEKRKTLSAPHMSDIRFVLFNGRVKIKKWKCVNYMCGKQAWW